MMTNKAFLALLLVVLVKGQSFFGPQIPNREHIAVWCTVNPEEQRKCEALADVLRASVLFNEYGQRAEIHQLNCTQTYNKDQCMVMLDNNVADITTLDPGEVFVGGREHSLVPFVEERYAEGLYSVAVIPKRSDIRSLYDVRGKQACFAGVGTLAGWITPMDKLLKKGGMEIVDCNNHVKSALAYFGKSCAVNSLSDKYNPLGDNSHQLCEICGSDLPGVRCTSNDPYSGYEGALMCLMDQGEIAFLKHSSIKEYYNKLNDLLAWRESQLELENRYPSSTQYPNFFPGGNRPTTTSTTQGPFFPFRGVQQGTSRDQNGNNASFPFGRNPVDDRRSRFDAESPNHPDYSPSAITEPPAIRGPTSYGAFKESYELLCEDGTRRDIDDWRFCNWGLLPSHALVTSSAKPYRGGRKRYAEFVENLFRQFGNLPDTSGQGGVTFTDKSFKLFESIPRYGNRSNLMFQDATNGFRPIPENDQTYVKYLGRHMDSILGIRACPVEKISLCITSDAEYNKCIKMRQALNAQLLKPEMICEKGHSHVDCIQRISQGNADTALLDAGDVYTAGYHYGLIPVMSEIYNTRNTKLGEPEYYAVAVAYQGDADTELTYLKGKTSCHSGIGHGAGWIIPMAYLISSGRMRNYGCDSVTAASQYFTKSCVPGALSKEHTFGSQHSNLCDLCRGSSFSYCSRDASEDFYGHTGAFRCLIEGGGQVAFVKHTTVSEVTDGKRRETWARNTLSGDYELLCRDGTRAPVGDYERCNLGKVKANAVVVRGGGSYNHNQTMAIINLFLYAQQYYGRKDEDDFNFGMFYSAPPYSDLIFQDAAQQLKVIPQEQRNYRDYLGKTFLKARALVDCRATAARLGFHVTFILGGVLVLIFRTR